MRDKLPPYVKRVLTAISVLLNAILGGRSYQTLSARNWQLKKEGKPNWVWLIDSIFWFEPDHCMHCWIHWKVVINPRDEVYSADSREIWLIKRKKSQKS